ncbi:MAG TPA: NAD(P)-binding domain-containing protein [Myxococcota bacterium]|nr:NAD(P)-binding domain-containing protein [Myxococcota bacterium]
MATLAVLGAGLLGSAFIERMLEDGHTVRAWNRTASKLDPLVARGAIACGSPAEAAAGADRVHLILSADDAVDAALAGLTGLAVPLIDHSTNLPARVAERAAAWPGYVHAPVFMSPANARAATGAILISGDPARVEPLLAALAPMTGRVWRAGPRPEAGAVLKLVGNALRIGLVGLLGDVFALTRGNGVADDDVLAMFTAIEAMGTLDYTSRRVALGGFPQVSFNLDMARKDVGLMVASAPDPAALVVLPELAAAMDEALAAGLGARDYAIYATHRHPARP